MDIIDLFKYVEKNFNEYPDDEHRVEIINTEYKMTFFKTESKMYLISCVGETKFKEIALFLFLRYEKMKLKQML